METSSGRAIILGCALVALALLATPAHNMYESHKSELSKQQAEQKAHTEEKKQKALAAWKRSINDLHSSADVYLWKSTGALSTFEYARVAAYKHSDITWISDKSVTVRGLVFGMYNKKEVQLAWTRKLEWPDDESWGASRAEFSPANLTEKEQEHMYVQPLPKDSRF